MPFDKSEGVVKRQFSVAMPSAPLDSQRVEDRRSETLAVNQLWADREPEIGRISDTHLIALVWRAAEPKR